MTLHARLEEIFCIVFRDDGLVLTDETSAIDIADWDSVAHMNLMFSIEQAFGIQFAGNELATLKNVGELKEYLKNRGCS